MIQLLESVGFQPMIGMNILVASSSFQLKIHCSERSGGNAVSKDCNQMYLFR